ncbi:MAG: RNA polymerase sigma factor [Clostridia bacterium]|nr:RNA polymerase sigma factor [Clostridia bacterium]
MKGGENVAQEHSEKLYETYYMRVFSFAMTLTGDRTQAEEITQETFFRAFSKQSGFRGASDEATWLCAIAKNLFLDERRRQGRNEAMPEEMPDTGKGIEQSAVDRDTSLRIHMALHALEEPYREVFELRVFGELSFRDVGMIFGKTENWARVTYHRARLKIQERMEKHGL